MLERRLIVVTGKGGVGKTTVSAALGLLGARRGLRTIVVEATGGEAGGEAAGTGRLSALLGHPEHPPHGVETQLRERLWGLAIDRDRVLAEWLRAIGGRVPARVLTSSSSFQYMIAAAPGAREMITMVKLWELAEGRRPGARGAQNGTGSTTAGERGASTTAAERGASTAGDKRSASVADKQSTNAADKRSASTAGDKQSTSAADKRRASAADKRGASTDTNGRGADTTAAARDYDLIVFDAPATGHALAMLRSPYTFGTIARMGPVARQAGQVRELLEDPSRTAYVAVTQATEMGVTETLELRAGLRRELGRELDSVIVNGTLPRRFEGEELRRIAALGGGSAAGQATPASNGAGDADDVVTRSAARAAQAVHERSRTQQRQIARLRRGAGPQDNAQPIMRVPFLFRSELDLEAIQHIADRLARGLG